MSQENPNRANGQIFNVRNPYNEVYVKQLAELMIQAYAKVVEVSPNIPIASVNSEEYYCFGYGDDSDRRIPDITIITSQLDILMDEEADPSNNQN